MVHLKAQAVLLAAVVSSFGFANVSSVQADVGDAETPATSLRLRLPIDEVNDLSQDGASVPLSHGPSATLGAVGIGPGSHLIITIPGEGTFGCTANFVWQNSTALFLGAAGHCFLPSSKTATHGPGADYNPSGVTVRACVFNCYFGGVTSNVFVGVLANLGSVVYARQTGVGGDLGNDFGLVEIPSSYVGAGLVRSQMPVWGGPSAEAIGVGFQPLVHFGYGVGYGETPATMARAGQGTGMASPGYFRMHGAASFGDSGSAVNTGVLDTSQGLHGHLAAGLITHLIVSLNGEVAGTTVPKAKLMATQASLTISVNTTL